MKLKVFSLKFKDSPKQFRVLLNIIVTAADYFDFVHETQITMQLTMTAEHVKFLSVTLYYFAVKYAVV